MAYDGSILLETKLDSKGIETGLKSMTGIIAAGAAAAGAALVALGASVIKVGSDFEAGMSKVQAISSASADDMVKLADKAKEMGAATKFSATESSEALTYMAMAGWKTQQMLDGLPGIMNLAAASGENLGLVSDIVTDALTGFGMAAEDSSRFADVLAAASNNANTNVAMLGESFKYVAPVAGALGYTVEDVSVALGLMANSGVKASMAGTALRELFTRLVKPTKESGAAMDALNISATNLDGTMKPLGELMLDLRDSFSSLTEAEKAQYAATLAGQRGMSGLLAIVNASEEDFNKLTGAIDNSAGTAQRMADIMNDNLQGQFVLLKSALEGVGIQIYEQFQEPLKSATQSAISSTNAMAQAFKRPEMVNSLKTLGNVVADFAAKAADLAAQALPKLVNAFAFLVEHGRTVATVIGAAAAAFYAFKVASSVGNVIFDIAKAFTAAQVQIALYSMNLGVATITEVAHASALTATEIIVGVLTGKIALATAAQAAWNAVMAINPVVLVAIGVAALAAAIVGATIAMGDNISEAKKYGEETQKLINQTNDVVDATKQSAEAYEDHARSLEVETRAASKLADEITALAAKENKSAKEKADLKAKIDLLNTSVEGLNLSWNEETGLLSKSTAEIKAQIESRNELLRVQAAQERAFEVTKQQISLEIEAEKQAQRRNEITTKLAETEKALADARQEQIAGMQNRVAVDSEALNTIQQLTSMSEEYKRQLIEVGATEEEIAAIAAGLAQEQDVLNRIIDEGTTKVEELGQEMEDLAAAGSDAMETFANVTQENIGAFLESLGLADKALEDSLSALDNYTIQATNLWGKLAEDQKVSIDEMIANLEYNSQAVEEWSTNLETLADRGVNQGLIETLRAAGPEARNSVAGLVDASDEQLGRLETAFEAGGQAAVNALLREMGAGNLATPIGQAFDDAAKAVEQNTAIETAAADKGPKTKEALDKSIVGTDFEGSGKNIVDGVGKGIDDNQEILIQAANDAVDATDEAFADAADAHSPAQRFVPHGENIDAGVAKGIEDKTSDITDAAKKSIDDTYNASEQEVRALNFERIGELITDGMAQGIRNGMSNMINAAIEAARAAYEAAKDELDIHSPSRKFGYLAEMSIKGYVDKLKSGKTQIGQATASTMQYAYAARGQQQAALATVGASTVNNYSTSSSEGGNITFAPGSIVVQVEKASTDADIDLISRKIGEKVSSQVRWKGGVRR